MANASAIKQLAAFTPNFQSIRGVAWSRDGRLLVVGTEADIYLWDMTNPACRAIWRGHTNEVSGIAWSPHDPRFATGDDDGKVCVWGV